jgi:hypothetical protein
LIYAIIDLVIIGKTMIKLNQKGFAVLEVVLVILALVAVGAAGYYVYQSKQDKSGYSSNAPKKTVEDKKRAPEEIPAKVLSVDKTSPGGSYTIFQTDVPGGSQKVGVKDKSGNIISDDVAPMDKVDDLGISSTDGQYGINFKGWTSDRYIAMSVGYGSGREDQFIVDASTGTIVSGTLKQIK